MMPESRGLKENFTVTKGAILINDIMTQSQELISYMVFGYPILNNYYFEIFVLMVFSCFVLYCMVLVQYR